MMNYLTKIQKISKINLTKICKELGINRSNLLNGRTSKSNEQKVYEKLVEEYTNIFKN